MADSATTTKASLVVYFPSDADVAQMMQLAEKLTVDANRTARPAARYEQNTEATYQVLDEHGLAVELSTEIILEREPF